MAVTIRKNDIRASNLLILAYSLVALSFFFRIPPSYGQLRGTIHDLVIASGLAIALLVGMVIGIRRGIFLVKVIFLLLTACDVVAYIVDFSFAGGIATTTVVSLLSTILKVWAATIIARDLLTPRPPADEARIS